MTRFVGWLSVLFERPMFPASWHNWAFNYYEDSSASTRTER